MITRLKPFFVKGKKKIIKKIPSGCFDLRKVVINDSWSNMHHTSEEKKKKRVEQQFDWLRNPQNQTNSIGTGSSSHWPKVKRVGRTRDLLSCSYMVWRTRDKNSINGVHVQRTRSRTQEKIPQSAIREITIYEAMSAKLWNTFHSSTQLSRLLSVYEYVSYLYGLWTHATKAFDNLKMVRICCQWYQLSHSSGYSTMFRSKAGPQTLRGFSLGAWTCSNTQLYLAVELFHVT
jgi:DNA-directed RNA polymerase subunit N (RpoN/RPB10)